METNNEAVETKHPVAVRLSEHEAIVAAALAEAGEGLPLPATPTIPILIHIEEAKKVVKAARKHGVALAGVGMPADLSEKLDRGSSALRSGETLWQATRRASKGGGIEELLEQGKKERSYLEAASTLALRKHADALRRIAALPQGDEPREVCANLAGFALVVTEHAAQFEAICVDVEATATGAAELAERLEEAALDEPGVQALARAKDVRDRLYALTLEPLADIRAYAQFALRNAPTAMKEEFTSEYARERRKVARQAKAARPGVAANDTPEVDDSVVGEALAKVA